MWQVLTLGRRCRCLPCGPTVAQEPAGGSIPGIDGQHADVSFGKTLHLLLITVYYSPPMIALCKIEK